MADRPPTDIRRFEMLGIASILIGLGHQLATGIDGVFETVFVTLLLLALVLLVSRGRKNWAKWVLAVFFIVGLAAMLWTPSMVFEEGIAGITIGVSVLQAIATALLFTRQSSHWLRGQAAPA